MKSHTYSTSVTSDSARWISREFSELVMELSAKGHEKRSTEPDFDVLIIGSGYGGAAAADVLADCREGDRPLRVAVIERGREYLPGMFPSRMSDLPTYVRGTFPGRRLGGEGLFDIRAGADMNVVLGSGLGGGSLINAGVMEVPHDDILKTQWPKDIAKAWTSGDLKDRYSQMRSDLGARPVPDSTHLAKREVLREIGKGDFRNAQITIASSPGIKTIAGVPLEACRNCGDCATGCNYGSKESLDTNLLARAAARGARLYCGGTALEVARSATAADAGWQVKLVHTDPKLRLREGEPLWVSTRKLILAAGALGSTELLMRSQRRDPTFAFSTWLGQGFSGNGDMISFGMGHARPVHAFGDEDRDPDQGRVGPTITGVVPVRLASGSPAVIEEMAVPGTIRRLAEEAVTTSRWLHDLLEIAPQDHSDGWPALEPCAIRESLIESTGVYAVIGDDGAGGTLRLRVGAEADEQDGSLDVVWPQARELPVFGQLNDAITEKVRSSRVGGRVVPNPLWRPLPEGRDRLLPVPRGPLVTVHPLGGCRMGNSAADGVVNSFGEVFRAGTEDVHQGLYVMDGAIMPRALATNPALTIAVLARRAAEHLRGQWTCTGGSPAPLARRPVHANADAGVADGAEFPPAWFKNGEPVRAGVASVADIVRDVRLRQNKAPATVEVMERMTGPIRLVDDEDKTWDCQLVLTMGFRPKPIRDLFRAVPDSENQLSGAELRIGQPASYDRYRPRSTARIFLESDWNHLRKSDVAPGETALTALALCTMELSENGTLRIMEREAAAAWRRQCRALRAWLCNRAIREYSGAPWDVRNVFERVRGKIKSRARRKIAREVGLDVDSGFPTGTLDKFRGWLRTLRILMASAGEVRLFDYSLSVAEVKVNPPLADEAAPRPRIDWDARFKGQPIRGSKRITYRHAENPWRQLMEMRLESFPCLSPKAPHPWLKLDPNYLVQRSTALLRIHSQPDHVSALADLASLAAYFGRMLLGIHNQSLRRPDLPRARQINRLPGRLEGLPEPEVHWIDVDEVDGKPIRIRLTRYALDLRKPRAASDPSPVLMIHGYSAGGNTFAHPVLTPSLAQVLAASGREAWIVDMRSSIGLDTAAMPWTFERIAFADIPVAVDFVARQCGVEQIDVVAHCMGAAMFSMAVLSAGSGIEQIRTERDQGMQDRFVSQRRALPGRIRRAVLSQVGPALVMTPQNAFRAFVYSYVTGLFAAQTYSFRPEPGDSGLMQILDMVLSTLPYPDAELRRVNHARPWKRDDFVGGRHRMDAIYGHTFELMNLSKEVLDHFDDLFGPINVDTVAQVSHFTRLRTITDRSGRNRFVGGTSLEEHWTFPTLSIHGQRNGLVDPATLSWMKRLMEMHGRPFKTWLVPGRGHQDCFIGRNAGHVCQRILKYLNCDSARSLEP